MADGRDGALELTIESTYDSLGEVAGFLQDAGKEAGIGDDEVADLVVSAMEAVNNAIQHGNQEDKSKKVHIRLEVASGRITLSVRDEGPGFDPSKLPDPRDTENILKSSGRGILMMRSFMDQVDFDVDETGTTVRMSKSLPAGGDP
jgi:serine/threonine-protein kinase RsbW